MKERSRKILRIAGYVGLFLVSTVFFLYITFPFSVLKETVSSEIKKFTGFGVRMEELATSFPVGLQARKVRIEAPGGAGALSFNKLQLKVGLLPLLVGRLGVSIHAEAGSEGTLTAASSVRIFKLLIGRGFDPSQIVLDILSDLSIEAEDFPVTELAAFGIGYYASAPTTNPFVAGLIGKVGFVGTLDLDAELDLKIANPSLSEGKIELSLKNALLKLSDPSINLPDQKFEKALVKAELVSGLLTVDQTSGFVTSDLSFTPRGKVTFAQSFAASQFDLSLGLKLDKDLKSNFGFLVDQLAGGSKDGAVTIQVRGPLGEPQVNTF